jgi:hypothetical protein
VSLSKLLAEQIEGLRNWVEGSARSAISLQSETKLRRMLHRRPFQVQGGTPNEDAIAKITTVAAAAREVRRVRAEALPKLKGGLRALYRALELPGANPLKDAHAALDAAVLAAYGFSAKKDLLA